MLPGLLQQTQLKSQGSPHPGHCGGGVGGDTMMTTTTHLRTSRSAGKGVRFRGTQPGRRGKEGLLTIRFFLGLESAKTNRGVTSARRVRPCASPRMGGSTLVRPAVWSTVDGFRIGAHAWAQRLPSRCSLRQRQWENWEARLSSHYAKRRTGLLPLSPPHTRTGGGQDRRTLQAEPRRLLLAQKLVCEDARRTQQLRVCFRPRA